MVVVCVCRGGGRGQGRGFGVCVAGVGLKETHWLKPVSVPDVIPPRPRRRASYGWDTEPPPSGLCACECVRVFVRVGVSSAFMRVCVCQ